MADRATVHELVDDLIQAEKYSSAIKLMKKYCVDDEEFVDRVIDRFLKKAKVSYSTRLDYKLVCRAGELLPLGPSIQMRERVLAAFVDMGWHRWAQDVAQNHLHRQLTLKEVVKIVKVYLDGAVYSSSEEEDLLKLVHQYGGVSLEEKTARQFAERREVGRFD